MLSAEPKEAFPYRPPTAELRAKYAHIFCLTEPLPLRFLKSLFDKVLSGLLLLGTIPILIIIKIAYLIEGFIFPQSRGPMLFRYNAVSAGKVFPKYKIRLIKIKYIDAEGAKRGDWRAFSAEWTPDSRTYTGHLVKKLYLDELPQFYNVLRGDMSIIGPRPLAVHHYERDLAQGNVTRKLLKGGLLGLGHVMKGTPEMGNPLYEYEYADSYLSLSSWGLLMLDLKIIFRGIRVMLRAKGL
jgi:lipopolysaccharide/colanic/teichoic acid biosynthesis glycosyltransferase